MISLKINKQLLSQDIAALVVVTILHLGILGGIFYKTQNSAQPVLSFSVTMVDLSSSQNTVASAASTSGSNSNKKKTQQEEMQSQEKMAKAKNEVKESSEKKSASKGAVDSMQQSAVLSPTKAAIFDAAYLSNAAPIYPSLSRRLKEEGLVVLNVLVNAEGKAQKVELKKSSGFSRLDEAAIETVKKWRFVAAQDGNKVVTSWVQIPINFILE